MLLKKVLIQKINVSIIMVLLHEEDHDQLIKDNRKDKVQRAHTCLNPKGHMPLVSLLLWRKMVAVCCFVWPSAL